MSKKREKKPGGAGKHFGMIAVAAALSVVLLASVVVGLLAYWDIVNIGFVDDILVAMCLKDPEYQPPAAADKPQQEEPEKPEEDQGPDLSTPYSVEAPDADAYYQNYATVHEQLPAQQSTAVREGSAVCGDFADRGFTEYPVTTQYDMDGTYGQEQSVSRYSSAKHPMYQTYYISTDGDIWLIYEINGQLCANPLSYNMELESGPQMMVSETGTLTTYDSTLNKFYVVTPKEDLIKITQVTRIDAETLEGLM